jgi:putative SOS response-associated peptidase YedK
VPLTGPPPIDSFTIITTPHDLVGRIDQRMPVILAQGDHDLWLDPGTRDHERLQPLLCPYSAEETEAYPVSARASDPANDSPECVARLA